MKIQVRAPSNIALIKYMGKKDASINLPENPSLSLTLHSLCSVIEVNRTEGGSGMVSWVPEAPTLAPENSLKYSLLVPDLKESGIGKMVRHFERVRNAAQQIFPRYGLETVQEEWKKRDYVLRSANTFPAASGIASSASAFAGLTLGMASALAKNPEAFQKAWNSETGLRRALAQISRMGSGSSCRSFEGPWVLWEGENTQKVNTPGMPEVAHFVVLIRTEPKKVSSSDAHTLIRTSPLWEGRVQRVEKRTEKLISALEKGDFPEVARIAWTEAWEMHSLFHTCAEPFSYWEPGTIDGLHGFAAMMHGPQREAVPPIVTLDAGPNIHVIVEKKNRSVWKERLQKQFPSCTILEDEQGQGADFLTMMTGVRTG